MYFVKYFCKYWLRIIDFISSELSPKKIAMTFAIGIPLGVVPFFCGLNILLSFLFAWKLKLNHLLIQTVSSIIYPLQILLYVPFMRLGVYLFSSDNLMFSTRLIMDSFQEDVFGTLRLIGIWNIYGLGAWLIAAFPVGIILYFVSFRIARMKIRRFYLMMISNQFDEESENDIFFYYLRLEDVAI